MAAKRNKFKLPRFLKETGVNLQKGGGCGDDEGVCVGGKGLWCRVCVCVCVCVCVRKRGRGREGGRGGGERERRKERRRGVRERSV